MARSPFVRLTVAIAAAAAVQLTATMMYLAAVLRDPFLLMVSAIGVVLPQSLVVIVALVFLTRFLARRGFGNLGVMILVGALLGPMPELATYLWERLTFAMPDEVGLGAPGMLTMLLVSAGIGAVASAVYWRLLDPTTYYARPLGVSGTPGR